jgi:LytS/YehU family sensor histidine kinase
MNGLIEWVPIIDAPFAPNGGPQFLQDRPRLFFVVDELRNHLYQFFTAIFFSFLLRTREHLNEIKEEKFEAEINSLKSQINPHFLFNTLNSIYILSLKKDDRASDAIINLSGIMRYAIKDARDAMIDLQKEIEYVENYIELQKARFGSTASIFFECSGEPKNMKISPLLLITYIENTFKYGINPDVVGCVVEVTIQITEVGLILHTFNKKVQLSPNEGATGIGLKNTRDRLEYFYPKKHRLDIIENNETYSVTLFIHLYD